MSRFWCIRICVIECIITDLSAWISNIRINIREFNLNSTGTFTCRSIITEVGSTWCTRIYCPLNIMSDTHLSRFEVHVVIICCKWFIAVNRISFVIVIWRSAGGNSPNTVRKFGTEIGIIVCSVGKYCISCALSCFDKSVTADINEFVKDIFVACRSGEVVFYTVNNNFCRTLRRICWNSNRWAWRIQIINNFGMDFVYCLITFSVVVEWQNAVAYWNVIIRIVTCRIYIDIITKRIEWSQCWIRGQCNIHSVEVRITHKVNSIND